MARMLEHFRAGASLAPLRPLWWLGSVYLILGAVTRMVLLGMAGHGVPHNAAYLAYAFAMGALFDAVTYVYLAWPLLAFLCLVRGDRAWVDSWRKMAVWLAILVGSFLLAWLVLYRLWRASFHDILPFLAAWVFLAPLPLLSRGNRLGRLALAVICLVSFFLMLFVGVAELVFWNEFGVRFNFIAVDYLVYTTEVIGNIQESYPVASWTALVALAAGLLLWLTRRSRRALGTLPAQAALAAVVVWLALTVGVSFAFTGALKDRTDNTYVNEIAGNGVYQFFNAFRNSRLDYQKFYRTLPRESAFARVRAQLATPDATYLDPSADDLTRLIRHSGPERHLNVVLISVESLSADYMAAFGNRDNLTPHLDALIKKSLFFDHVYANGTRTVRGLEALSLSVPPTPGDSIIKMKGNENLFSLASIFNDRGYVSEFVYGGYGYFDNMNYFFGHNGYRTVDRNAIPPGAVIHHENVWGVADEDLFTLALGQMDAVHASGKPFFLHIMTTSNHRPYTFPTGRVPFPEGSRPGAVAYTDWAIDDFLRRSRDKAYFADTVFVITADHDAASAGKTSIPLNRYRIPLLIYAPDRIPPGRIDRLMAQIDIPPTLLGLLNFSYRSRFFGYDLQALPPGRERAFPSTYQKLGYLHAGALTVLAPQRSVTQFDASPAEAEKTPGSIDQTQVNDAIAYYQVAASLMKSGGLRRRPDDSAGVAAVPASAASASPAASIGQNAKAAPAQAGQ